jgi:hypothetical protein
MGTFCEQQKCQFYQYACGPLPPPPPANVRPGSHITLFLHIVVGSGDRLSARGAAGAPRARAVKPGL